MTSRFEIERAVLRSDLPASCRHVTHVLCVSIDAKTNTILPAFQPSLTQLARDTGYHRRTIMRILNVLEHRGWVTRRRPTAEDARKKHARTHYSVHIPDLGTSRHGARDSMSPELGQLMSPELGTPSPEARDLVPHSSSTSSWSDWSSDGEVIDSIIEAIREVSRTTVTPTWAARVADQLLGARDSTRARHPAAYARAKILRAPPDTYRPTPEPPRFTAEKGFTNA